MASPARRSPDPRAVRSYPEDLEASFVARARARAPKSTENEALDRAARAASSLSDLFTTDRPDVFPDYAAEEDLRVAYGLYFAPQTWVRARFPFAEAVEARGWRPASADRLRVADLGCGIGSAGLSVAQWALARGLASRASLLGVDRSVAALSAFEALGRERLPSLAGIEIGTTRGDLSHGDPLRGAADPFDVIVLSFALNEAFSDRTDDQARAFLRGLLPHLDPGGLVLLLEPALRATSERLRAIAAPLAEEGVLHVVAPGWTGRVSAPPPDRAYFDHEVRRWRAPPSLKTMNRRLGRSLDELTFSFLVLSPRPLPLAPPDPRRTRLTSPLARLKGRLAATGLDGDGARSTYDLLERHIDDDARARLRGVERGDHVLLPKISPLREPGWFRIASPADLEVLWHPE